MKHTSQMGTPEQGARLNGGAATARIVRMTKGKELTKELSGQRVGMLTITGSAPSVGTGARWRCKCDCGVELIRSRNALNRTIRDGYEASCDACRIAKQRAK